MDATPSKKHPRHSSAVIVLCMVATTAWQCSYLPAAESGSASTIVVTSSNSKPQDKTSSQSSAHGTLTFVVPSKTSAEPARSKQRRKPNRFAQSLNALRDSAGEQPVPQAGTKTRSVPPKEAVQTTKPTSAQRRPSSASSKVRQLTTSIRATSHRSEQLLKNGEETLRTKTSNEVEVASYEEPSQPEPVARATKLLINAHDRSQRATSEADYTQVIQECTKAVHAGLRRESKLFAQQLISWALNRRGQLRADHGQQDLAAADFRTALDYNSKNWRALHNRGVSYAESGMFAEAFDDFNRVIQLNPFFAKAFANRATLYAQANDLQAALADYERAERLDPESTKAKVGIGRICHMLGQWDKSLTHYTAALEMKPENAEVTCSRADLLADMGRYEEALADYAHTIEIDPEFGHAYRNGAWLLATCPESQFRDAENAVLGARQALEFDYGQRHVALDTLAAALANAGEFEEAVSTLQYALNIAPAEAKTVYASRLQLYQQQQPYRTGPKGNVEQAVYEVTDR